jgi:hypothetical protein
MADSIKINFTTVSCGYAIWMELPDDYAEEWALILTVLR